MPDASLPTGTVTFLMTDIEGSTKLWEAHPDAMPEALARHDNFANAVVSARNGVLVKSRGEGDSLFCVFENASDAVFAACEMQRGLLLEPLLFHESLRVRMALHTGDVTFRDGDYYGQTVNRCARLRAIAYGGQVVLSENTAEIVRDFLPPGATLTEPVRCRLKDLQQPENVYQLRHPELPSDFAPFRSLEFLPNNLPPQNTSFEGRDKEIGEVKELLQTTRLLTLIGAGGSGKTRLALQVAADLLDGEGDGVWLIELAPLSDANLVPQALASVLKIREEPQRPLTQTLCEALQDKRMMIMFDNCEHLLTACAQLCQALLRACPGLHIVASSREGLGVPGEVLYRVPSLSLPDPKLPFTPEILQRSEAVRLFVARAQSAQPSFVLSSGNAPAIAQVCQRLDGIPFALELAAARVRALPVEQIAGRLDDRFRLLTGGARTALPRQQTLRATLDWSYGLLSVEEQALLRRLSIFLGGWTLDGAEAVCADPE